MVRQRLVRSLIGGLIGAAALFWAGGFLNGLVEDGLPALQVNFAFEAVSSDLIERVGSDMLAMAIQMLLYFAFGAAVGAAALLFSDEGGMLALRSLIHFILTAVFFSLIVWLCGWAWNGQTWLLELGLMALAYLLIWLARWGVWYIDQNGIRAKPDPAASKAPCDKEHLL